MYTIVEKSNGKVLFAKLDDEILEGQIAIEQICAIDNSEQKEIFFNFATNEFYIV